MKRVNPFVYGRPLRPDEFFDRKGKLNSLWDRILKDQSSAVIGEPMIGKTSLLMKISDIASFKEAKGLDDMEAAKFKFVLLDCMTFETWLNPNGFWQKIYRKLKRETGEDSEFQRILQKFEKTFDTFEDRKYFFREIGSKGYRVVLMLDEFETLLRHPNFRTPDFYGQLRHLANLTGGLIVIAASRMSVSKLNREGRGILDVGSPFFNHLKPYKLKKFDGSTVEEFLAKRVPEWGEREKKFIIGMAGHHPALIQGVGQLLWEELQKSDDFEKAQLRVCERLNETLRDHFDTIWEGFSDSEKLAAFVVAIGDILELPWGENAKELDPLKKANFKEIMAQRNIQRGLEELNELGFIVPKKDNEADFDVVSRAFLLWLKDKMGEEDFQPVDWGKNVGVKSSLLVEISDKTVKVFKRLSTELFWEAVTNKILAIGSILFM